MKLKIIGLVVAIIIIVLSVFMYKTNKSGDDKKLITAEIDEGKELIEKSDCLSCHKLNIKFIGPSYKDVAVKYPANDSNYNLLVQKVINGGTGVWGEVPMSPHPDLTQADAKKMVQYILAIQ